MNIQADVTEFHRMAGQPIGETPHTLDPASFHRRIRLILEELSEMTTAHADGDLVGFADGCIDLIYVIVGTMVEAGIPFEPCWNEIQKSNMSKLGGHLDVSGKYVKPPTYVPADLMPILMGVKN